MLPRPLDAILHTFVVVKTLRVLMNDVGRDGIEERSIVRDDDHCAFSARFEATM